jgi:phosphoglycolate phosphatase
MTNACDLVDGAQAVVFDLDGTLVDTFGDLWQSINSALGQYGLPPVSGQLVLANIHLGLDGTTRAALRSLGAQDSHFASVAESHRAHYRQREHAGSRLYPGVRDFLVACRLQGRSMAVCTNKPTGDARDLLSLLKVADFFADVIGIDAGCPPKPDPAPLLFTLARLGRAAAEAVFVGDSVVDAQCAKSAGVPFLLHDAGYGGEEARAFGCTGRFRSYGELVGRRPASAPPQPCQTDLPG